MIDTIENSDIDKDICKWLKKYTKKAITRGPYQLWVIDNHKRLGFISNTKSRVFGITNSDNRVLPYPNTDGLGDKNSIHRQTRNKIEKILGQEYATGYTNMENSIIMTQSNSSYIRGVNDYTISVHEMYTNEFNSSPHVSAIVNIKDAPFTEITNLRTDIEGFVIANGYKKVRDGEITYSDDEEVDTYSVYKQNVSLYVKENSLNIGIELLGTTKLICITIIGNDQNINDKLIQHIKDTKKKYKTNEEVRKDKTFYTISSSQRGFELEDLNIKTEHLKSIIFDNYNDDFINADEVIKSAIDNDKKGLILLHGIPGTGKTSYIKHLITGDSKRKIIYIPTHLTSAISSPNFISFVKSDLSNSVLVIEDAEQVLLTRENGESHKEAVSNILNMTDGILADALNILIICTFNTDMENIDKALLRKGRLLLQYKFDELSKDKTDALCNKLFGKTTGKAMPLSDIYGLDYELITPKEKTKVKFGFVK